MSEIIRNSAAKSIPVLAFMLFTLFILQYDEIKAQNREDSSKTYLLPRLESKAPEYCFLELPSSKNKMKKILIVIDGSKLYIDFNSNRDLTESGELVRSSSKEKLSWQQRLFEIPKIKVGECVHESFSLAVWPLRDFDGSIPVIKQTLKRNPNANAYQLSVSVEDRRLSGNGKLVWMSAGIMDIDGLLQFGSEIGSAPTVRFGGDLEIRLSRPVKLRPGSIVEIVAAVGAKGNGDGTFAAIAYENVIPSSRHPNAQLKYSSEQRKIPVKHSPLKERC